MVTIAVVTLSHHKLQKCQGCWFKQLSGSVIAILLMLAPDLLVF